MDIEENCPSQLDDIFDNAMDKTKETIARRKLRGKIPERKKSHGCLDCGRVFTSSHLLRQHSYVHTGEKPYKCQICDKRFRHYTSIRRHMMVHSGVKHYKCTQCDRLFRDSSNLRQHLDSHKSHKSFICNVCNRSYKTKRTLQNHKCTVEFMEHANLYEQLKGITNYCRIEFRQDNYTQRANGAGTRIMHCNICSRQFTNIKLFLIHLVMDHGVNLNLVKITKSTKQNIKEHIGKSKSQTRIATKKKQPNIKGDNVRKTRTKSTIPKSKSVRSPKTDAPLKKRDGEEDSSMRYNCIICGRIIKRLRYLKTHLRKYHAIQFDDLSESEKTLSKFKISDDNLHTLNQTDFNHSLFDNALNGKQICDVYNFSGEESDCEISPPLNITRHPKTQTQGGLADVNDLANSTTIADKSNSGQQPKDLFDFTDDDYSESDSILPPLNIARQTHVTLGELKTSKKAKAKHTNRNHFLCASIFDGCSDESDQCDDEVQKETTFGNLKIGNEGEHDAQTSESINGWVQCEDMLGEEEEEKEDEEEEDDEDEASEDDVEWEIYLDSETAPMVLKDVYDFDENDDIESVCLDEDAIRRLNSKTKFRFKDATYSLGSVDTEDVSIRIESIPERARYSGKLNESVSEKDCVKNIYDFESDSSE